MKSVLIDCRAPKKAKDSLMRYGYNVIELPQSQYLPEGISAHPDSLLSKLGNNIITFADYCDEAAYVFSDIRKAHPTLSVRFSQESPTRIYPEDAKYNALVMGNKVFARLDSLSTAVKEIAVSENFELINVKQGYPACATLVLAPLHAITADRGLARALDAHEIEVTLIEGGGILLPPYNYGFIGGAAGVCDGRVYFVGDYMTHPSGKDIESCVKALGLTPISLTEDSLIDVGGLVFLN